MAHKFKLLRYHVVRCEKTSIDRCNHWVFVTEVRLLAIGCATLMNALSLKYTYYVEADYIDKQSNEFLRKRIY